MAMLFAPDGVFLQRFLRAGGYYRHDVDGLLGALSRQALSLFESDTENVRHELGRFDARSERAIATLLLPAQRAARKFIAATAGAGLGAGLVARIVSGTRTFAEQEALFAQGRTRPGAIVTRARAGQSSHNFGIAWDVGLFNRAGQYVDDLVRTRRMTRQAVEAEYRKLGAVGRELGLFWGGDWRTPDRPHFQLLDNDRLPAIRERFLHGGTVI